MTAKVRASTIGQQRRTPGNPRLSAFYTREALDFAGLFLLLGVLLAALVAVSLRGGHFSDISTHLLIGAVACGLCARQVRFNFRLAHRARRGLPIAAADTPSFGPDHQSWAKRLGDAVLVARQRKEEQRRKEELAARLAEEEAQAVEARDAERRSRMTMRDIAKAKASRRTG